MNSINANQVSYRQGKKKVNDGGVEPRGRGEARARGRVLDIFDPFV